MNYLVTCRTAGCLNKQVPIEIATDTALGTMPVICGPCGQTITDIKENP